jgi:IS1 family transposase
MSYLRIKEKADIIRCLCEGNSLRAVERMTGTARNTITKLLVEVGSACMTYHDLNVRGLKSKTVQCDEIWAFVGCKEQHLKRHTTDTKGLGSVWTWTALDADSKLLVSYAVGTRDASMALDFMEDVASRVTDRIQLTTDGHSVYIKAVENSFGGDVDYAMLVKHYGKDENPDHRYSPPVCTGCTKMPMTGNPDKSKISTSYVERHNLTIRMHNRRFTRLTNAFSKKLANHEASVALFAFHYNFCRSHQTLTKAAKGLKTTPAMAAGLTDHVWTADELVHLLA